MSVMTGPGTISGILGFTPWMVPGGRGVVICTVDSPTFGRLGPCDGDSRKAVAEAKHVPCRSKVTVIQSQYQLKAFLPWPGSSGDEYLLEKVPALGSAPRRALAGQAAVKDPIRFPGDFFHFRRFSPFGPLSRGCHSSRTWFCGHLLHLVWPHG